MCKQKASQFMFLYLSLVCRSWLISGGDSLPAVAKSVRTASTLRRERREDEPLYDSAAGTRCTVHLLKMIVHTRVGVVAHGCGWVGGWVGGTVCVFQCLPRQTYSGPPPPIHFLSLFMRYTTNAGVCLCKPRLNVFLLFPSPLGRLGLLPQQINVEELYAKVQKPRDRKKAANKETAAAAAAGKEKEKEMMMMNGSTHSMEDSSPPPLPVAGMLCSYCLSIHPYCIETYLLCSI